MHANTNIPAGMHGVEMQKNVSCSRTVNASARKNKFTWAPMRKSLSYNTTYYIRFYFFIWSFFACFFWNKAYATSHSTHSKLRFFQWATSKTGSLGCRAAAYPFWKGRTAAALKYNGSTHVAERRPCMPTAVKRSCARASCVANHGSWATFTQFHSVTNTRRFMPFHAVSQC